MMRRDSLRLIVLLGALSTACSELYDEIVFDNTPLCTPAATRECHCDDGAAGQQACLETGDDYGECECSLDAGVDGTEETDAGVDAPFDATSSVDAPTDGVTP